MMRSANFVQTSVKLCENDMLEENATPQHGRFLTNETLYSECVSSVGQILRVSESLELRLNPSVVVLGDKRVNRAHSACNGKTLHIIVFG